MQKKNSLLLHIGPLYFLLFLGILAVYFFSPFNNNCISGSCINGFGVYSFHSGIKYEGEWENGKRNGEGTLSYPNGSKYKGEWKDNRYHGNGAKTYGNRKMLYYNGDWRDGKKHGKGTQYFSPKEWYKGEWKNGEMHGLGTYVTSLNHKYVGEWKHGLMHGSGTYYYSNGGILTGNWRNHRKNGRGIMTYPDGTVIKEQWKNGLLVGSPDFYMSEFESGYNLIHLYEAIEADVDLPLKKRINKVNWLNDLLKTPNYYETLYNKMDESAFSGEILSLVENTKLYRSSAFSELTIPIQNDIKLLNRLLIEHSYPNKAPKIKR